MKKYKKDHFQQKAGFVIFKITQLRGLKMENHDFAENKHFLCFVMLFHGSGVFLELTPPPALELPPFVRNKIL